MIKITIQSLLNALNGLEDLAKKPMNPTLALQIARIIKCVREETQTYHNTALSYGLPFVETENGEPIVNEHGDMTVKKEHRDEYYKQLEQLRSTEITINADLIPLSQLKTLSDITPLVFMGLNDLISEDE